MSDHNKKTLFDIDQKILFHREHLSKLGALREGLLTTFQDELFPAHPILIKPGDTSPTTRKKALPDPNSGKADGDVGNSPSTPGAGKERGGRLGQTDRARAIILSLPGRFTHDQALQAITKAGLPFKKAYTLLGSLLKAKKLDKFSASEYFVPGRNATTAAAAIAKSSPVKRGGQNINASLRENILSYLGAAEAPVKLKQIASDLKNDANAIRQVLARMVKDRTVVKATRGRYGLPNASQCKEAKPSAAPSVPSAKPSHSVPSAPAAAEDEGPPPPTGSISDILARHNVLIEDMDPFHPGAIEIGRTFLGDFTLTDAQARIGRKPAGYWLARWKENGWIETVGLSTYRRTATFGQKP
jgi:hypothetical protein